MKDNFLRKLVSRNLEKEADGFQEVDLASGSNSLWSSLDFAEFSASSDVLLDSVGALVGATGAWIGSTGGLMGVVAVLKRRFGRRQIR